MDEITQPGWLMQDGQPPAQRGNPAWRKGGPSPNPAGRPRGVLDKRTKVTQALADDAPQVARVVIDAAMAGDIQAASLVLSRVAPPLRAQAERVGFSLDSGAPLSQQAQQILQAVADGNVDADTGKTLIGCVQAVASIRAVEDLEQRIILLEAKQV